MTLKLWRTRRLAANFKMLKTSLDVHHTLENYALVKRNPPLPPRDILGKLTLTCVKTEKMPHPMGTLFVNIYRVRNYCIPYVCCRQTLSKTSLHGAKYLLNRFPKHNHVPGAVEGGGYVWLVHYNKDLDVTSVDYNVEHFQYFKTSQT